MATLEHDMEHTLEKRQSFERLLAEISTCFVNLPAEKIDSGIEEGLRNVCEYLELDFAALWQLSGDPPGFYILTHSYRAVGEMPIPGRLEAQETFPWCLQQVLAGKVIDVSTEKAPAEAACDQETWRQFGVKSSLVFPLAPGGGQPIGALSYNTVRAERSWPKPFVKNLELLAQIFANALARKRSEESLRESEARLSLAAESAQAGLWELDCKTRTFWATGRARALFGYDPEEVISMERFEASVHPDDLELVQLSITRALDKREPVNVEYRILLGDDSLRWISSRGRAHFNQSGEPERLMGVSIDISECKQLEEQLRERLIEIEGLKQQLEKENIYLREEIELRNIHQEIVGRSSAMKQILAQVEQVARTDSTVLLSGETGTGKELLAQAIHRLSHRKGRTFVTVNCASLPPTLIESELFGREKGAYTGALTRMTGRFELANGGTLLLDEIGELATDVQAKLLRVLEQGSFERLGSSKPLTVDVRIIAATNQDLSREVAEGRFRKDLYYRLSVFPIAVPPLRERLEDIPPLVWAFVRQFEKKMGKRIEHIPRKSMENLQRHSWPGNARELRNVVEHAMIVSTGKTLYVLLPQSISSEMPANLDLENVERRHILGVLKRTGWRLAGQGGAAAILGLKRTTLQSKMKKLGIQRPPK